MSMTDDSLDLATVRRLTDEQLEHLIRLLERGEGLARAAAYVRDALRPRLTLIHATPQKESA